MIPASGPDGMQNDMLLARAEAAAGPTDSLVEAFDVGMEDAAIRQGDVDGGGAACKALLRHDIGHDVRIRQDGAVRPDDAARAAGPPAHGTVPNLRSGLQTQTSHHSSRENALFPEALIPA